MSDHHESTATLASNVAEFPLVLRDQRCSAVSQQNGGRCQRTAVPGATVCRIHGGAAPQVQSAAIDRLKTARDLALHRLHEQLDSADGFDPRVLLDIVTKLTDKVELLEGRATARSESKTEVDVRQVKLDFIAKLEAEAERVRRVEEML